VTAFAPRAKAAWARLIRKVYEADLLECPNYKSPMRVIALVENASEQPGCGPELASRWRLE